MLTFKLLSMATLLGVATGLTHVATPQKMKVVTWNEGGGAPTTEFFGPWSEGVYGGVEKALGAWILKFTYGSVAEAIKSVKAPMDFSRYQDDVATLDYTDTTTVGDLLKGLEAYLIADAKIDGTIFPMFGNQ